MATENKENLSKSMDYEDSFEDPKISFEQNDSFGNKIDQVYNDHKKVQGVDTKFESQNTHRPLSKYQRASSAKREPTPEEKNFDLEKFKEKLNNHLQKNRIMQTDFTENTQIFVTKDELKDLFKAIRFDLYSNEIDFLFENENPSKEDGFLYIDSFLSRYNFEFFTKTEKSSISNENSKNNFSINEISPQRTKGGYRHVDEQFASFKNDILNIIEGSDPKKSNKLPPITSEQKKSQQKKKPQKEKKNDSSSLPTQSNRPKSSVTLNNNNNNKEKPQTNYLRQTLQRQMLEEDMMKLAIEKRNKEFQRDCVRKMVLANEYAETLGKPVSFSAYAEEGDSVIVCRVWNKNDKTYNDINLKQFMIQFKNLQKEINQNEERKKYRKVVEEDTKKQAGKGETDFFKMNRKQKHQVIKKILKESLELKILLKKQLKALRDKNLIDISIINKNLRLTNLDDDSII